jgi:ribosomal protein L27
MIDGIVRFEHATKERKRVSVYALAVESAEAGQAETRN